MAGFSDLSCPGIHAGACEMSTMLGRFFGGNYAGSAQTAVPYASTSVRLRWPTPSSVAS